MNIEAKRPRTELDSQFRREARIGGAVIVIAMLGFVAVAYLRISGRLDREGWVGEIPPPAANFEQLGSPPSLVDGGDASEVDRDRQPAPTLASVHSQPTDIDSALRPATVASTGGGQLALSASTRSEPPPSPPAASILPYDRLTQLRGPQPGIQNQAPQPGPASNSLEGPKISAEFSRPPPATGTEFVDRMRPKLPPAPHLGLPGPSAWPTTRQPASVIPIRPPYRDPDSTATVTIGGNQRRVSTFADELGAEPPLRDQRMYITVEGDTLFTIAAESLGQASRFVELLELNRAILPAGAGSSTHLPAGLPLHLPETE